MNRKCAWCGSEFMAMSSREAYCSDSCRRLAKNSRSIKRRMAGLRVHRKKCEECGTSFETTKSNKRFCCEKCEKRNRAHARYRRTYVPSPRKGKADTAAPSSVYSTTLTEAQMASVMMDMSLPDEKRYAKSLKWTQAMRRYAMRIDLERHNTNTVYN